MSPELLDASMDVANAQTALAARREPRADRPLSQRDPIHRSPRAQARMAEADWIGAINRQAQANVERDWRRSEPRASTVPAWLSALGLYCCGVITGAMTVIFVAGWL
jgi:hypothetical protein